MVVHGAPPPYPKNTSCVACHMPITEDELKCQSCPNVSYCYPCYDGDMGLRHRHEHAFVRFIVDPQSGRRRPAHQANCDVCQKPVTTSLYLCKPCLDYSACEPCFLHSAEVKRHRQTHFFYKVDDYSALRLQSEKMVTLKHNFLCDGVLCRGKNKNVMGNMYLCAVCNDFALCEACETSPLNDHNVSHVVQKFKLPMSQEDFQKKKQSIAASREADVTNAAFNNGMMTLMRARVNATNAYGFAQNPTHGQW